jgi:uncharacterized protein (DUF2164 family)
VAPRIAFDRAAQEALARRLVRRLREELDLEVEPMDGQRLIDILSEILGPAWYNQGLRDAQAALQARVDDIAEAIAGLEQPEPR